LELLQKSMRTVAILVVLVLAFVAANRHPEQKCLRCQSICKGFKRGFALQSCLAKCDNFCAASDALADQSGEYTPQYCHMCDYMFDRNKKPDQWTHCRVRCIETTRAPVKKFCWSCNSYTGFQYAQCKNGCVAERNCEQFRVSDYPLYFECKVYNGERALPRK
jgi:hypothetical protein